MTITLDRPLTEAEHEADTFLGFEEGWDFGFEITDEHDKACERKGEPACGNQAVFKVWWGPDESMPEGLRDGCRNTALMCLTCFEFLTQPESSVTCYYCDRSSGAIRFKKIVYSETIR